MEKFECYSFVRMMFRIIMQKKCLKYSKKELCVTGLLFEPLCCLNYLISWLEVLLVLVLNVMHTLA